jgi:hypothetical protein
VPNPWNSSRELVHEDDIERLGGLDGGKEGVNKRRECGRVGECDEGEHKLEGEGKLLRDGQGQVKEAHEGAGNDRPDNVYF